MNRFIEFDYETTDDQNLIVEGETDGDKVTFTAKNENNRTVPKSKLNKLDIRNIEEFILDNADEYESQSDWYDCYD